MNSMRNFLIGLLASISMVTCAHAKELSIQLTKVADAISIHRGTEARRAVTVKVPYVGANGKVVFYAILSSHKQGVYTNVNNYVQMIADSSTPIPDYPESRFRAFGHIVSPAMLDDQVIFSGMGFLNQYDIVGIYRFKKDKLSTVISNKRLETKKNEENIFHDISFPSFLGSKGDVIFIGTDDKGQACIYQMDTKKHISMLVNQYTAVPHRPKNSFFHITYLSTSHDRKNKTFAFLAKDKNDPYPALYLYQNKKIDLIAGQNTPVPDGVGTLRDIESPAIDDKTGDIVFVGRSALGQEGIYLYNGKALEKVADQQDIIPKETDKYKQFFTPSIDNDRIVFRATGHKEQQGLYFYERGKVYKILSTRDSINKHQITEFQLSRHAITDDTIAMLVNFEDARTSIYTANFKFED